MILHKEMKNRLRAGALVVLVEEPDELLALEAAKLAAQPFQPITVMSAADPACQGALEKHPRGEGTLILLDFLRSFGSNPIAMRRVREVALQSRETGGYSRLILIESPGLNVPASLATDVEFILPELPSVEELRQELDAFVKAHDVKIKGNGEELHAIATAVAGLARHEAARLFARCWVDKQALDPIWLRKQKAERVAERLKGALTFVDTDAAGVGGLQGLKGWLKARRAAFASELARKFGLPEPKGVLLIGPPGTGKSLTAKTVAREWGVPLLRLDIGKMFGSLVGQSEAQTRAAIDAAEACAPCVLWLDEIEKGLASGGQDGGTSKRVLGTILTWLQEKKKPVFIVATANKVLDLPPELLRKGRFDEIFFVDLPSHEDRKQIARIHLERHERSVKDYKIAEIANVCEGFSGAEIEQAVIDGMFKAFDEKREVKTEDIVEAANLTTPLSETMEEDIKALRHWATGRARAASVAESTPAGAVRRATVSA